MKARLLPRSRGAFISRPEPYPSLSSAILAALYASISQCPNWSIRRSILSAKPRMAHRLTSKLLQDTCDRILGEVKTSTGVAGEVYQIIASTPGHSPSMADVARRIGTTVRTLNRKLTAEDTSFTQILDDVRCNFASEYLRSTKLSIDDISELVGFSDAANFRHAFRRWTGSTPAHYRL